MRTFIAIPLSDEIKEKLAETQKHLRKGIGYGISWVDPSLTHITVKFLGEIDERSIPDLKETLQNIVRNTKPFKIACGGLGCFPNVRHPRVIWLGVKRESQLNELHNRIENSLSTLGYPKEEKIFSPHLTLGRVKEELTETELIVLSEFIKNEKENPLMVLPVNELILFKSLLSRTGPVYTQISFFRLDEGQK